MIFLPISALARSTICGSGDLAGTAIADSGFLVALLRRADECHRWAENQAAQHARPWRTCEAALTEAFFVLGRAGAPALSALLRRQAVVVSFELGSNVLPVLELMQKYKDMPMSLADACLVRMTELHAEAVVLTTDSDFAIYRRHGRQVVPHVRPL
jgi:predicted nucleic acid-binding protein